MKTFLYLITFLIVVNPLSQARAKCVLDVFSAGLSFDSVAYKGSRGARAFATLATESGAGIKGSWFAFCPKKKMEFNTYIRLRFLDFGDANKRSEFSGVTQEEVLPSFGLEGRKQIKLFKRYFEIPLDVELRNELGMIANDSLSFLISKKYWNAKVMSGLRYFAWRKGKRDITVMGKLGPLIPITSNGERTSIGLIYGLSTEYYQKLGKRASLRTDLYYDVYNQDYGNLEMSRRELGIRANIVFRI